MKIELEMIKGGLLILLNDSEFYANWFGLLLTTYIVIVLLVWRIVAQCHPKRREAIMDGAMIGLLWPAFLLAFVVFVAIRYTVFLSYQEK